MHTTLNISEAELVKGLKEQRQEAFSYLYDNYSPALLGIIFALVGEQDDAENLLQDSFIKIWRNIHSYDPQKGRLFTWLVTICRNTALSHIRIKWKMPLVEIQSEDHKVYTESANAKIDAGLINLIVGMEPAYRDVMRLVYFFGYTQQEASEILHLPLGTVKTRIRLALQYLRKQCLDE